MKLFRRRDKPTKENAKVDKFLDEEEKLQARQNLKAAQLANAQMDDRLRRIAQVVQRGRK